MTAILEKRLDKIEAALVKRQAQRIRDRIGRYTIEYQENILRLNALDALGVELSTDDRQTLDEYHQEFDCPASVKIEGFRMDYEQLRDERNYDVTLSEFIRLMYFIFIEILTEFAHESGIEPSTDAIIKAVNKIYSIPGWPTMNRVINSIDRDEIETRINETVAAIEAKEEASAEDTPQDIPQDNFFSLLGGKPQDNIITQPVIEPIDERRYDRPAGIIDAGVMPVDIRSVETEVQPVSNGTIRATYRGNLLGNFTCWIDDRIELIRHGHGYEMTIEAFNRLKDEDSGWTYTRS